MVTLEFLSLHKKKFFFIAASIILLGTILAPLPGPINTGQKTLTLTLQGKAAFAVLTFAVILWITEAVPFAITGLIAISLLVMTGAAPFKTLVKDGFGNPIILFFIGVLIFSAAIGATTLLKRTAALILYRLGHSPALIILAFLIIGVLLSGWITDMAVAAMLLPLGVSILKDINAVPLESNFGKALMISCAWGPHIGGISTPAGCGPNPLTISFLKDIAGINFTFLNWMALGVPAMLLMTPFAWIVLIKFFPLEKIKINISKEELNAKFKEMGPVSKKEIFTLAIFGLTILLWIAAPFIQKVTGGAVNYLSISFVAITCSALLFLPGIEAITWKYAEENISWGGIILVVSGLSLGMTIYKTGAAEWVAWICFHSIGGLNPVMIIFIVVFGISIMKVMFSSNTVTGIIVVPLLLALAKNIGINPALLGIPAGITSSLAFILVTSTPTNIIPYSAGYFTIGDMAKSGIIMAVVSSICVTLSIYVFGSLIGLI